MDFILEDYFEGSKWKKSVTQSEEVKAMTERLKAMRYNEVEKSPFRGELRVSASAKEKNSLPNSWEARVWIDMNILRVAFLCPEGCSEINIEIFGRSFSLGGIYEGLKARFSEAYKE